MPPGNFEILHALKCVLGAPEALYRAAHSTYIPASCCLRLAISDQEVFTGWRALSIVSLLMSGHGRGHEPQED